MQPFLALITPIGGGPVDPGYGVPGWPSHPIAPGGPPPRPWGPVYYPDQGLPGPQPGQPPRMWGPILYPDQGLPGWQPGSGQPPKPWGPINYPDQGLPRPPPIIWGGGGVGDYIDAGFPGPQPGRPPQIWGGPYFPPIASWGPGFPTNPIVIPLPPEHQNPPEAGKPPPPDGGWGYSPEYGWGYFPPENVAKPKKPGEQSK